MSTTAAPKQEKQLTFREVMDKAGKSAFRGGIAGAAAMGANVACLMWMRTTVRECLMMILCCSVCRDLLFHESSYHTSFYALLMLGQLPIS